MDRVKYQCSFCGKAHQEVHRLIAGPDAVFICNECAVQFEASGATAKLEQSPVECSFCGGVDSQREWLVGSKLKSEVKICNKCVDLCIEIINDVNTNSE